MVLATLLDPMSLSHLLYCSILPSNCRCCSVQKKAESSSSMHRQLLVDYKDAVYRRS